MNFKEQIHDYIQGHKREIVDTLKNLIAISSVRGEAEETAPFGRECARVLEFTQKLYDENGFDMGNFLFKSGSERTANDPWYYGYMTELDIDRTGICLHIVPYRFDPETSKISVFEGNDKERMLSYVGTLSEIIQHPDLLDSYFGGWAYLHKWIPRAPSDYRDLNGYDSSGNYNLIHCESHYSQAKKVLELCFLDRVEEARTWAEKIKELTVMPV